MFKRNKYGAKRKEVDGINFHSTSEADYYIHLKEEGVNIVELQPKVRLTKANLLYKPDFLIEEDGVLVYIDVKGFETPVFKIKKRLWKAYREDELRLVKRSGKKFKTIERINV